jgi:hypothetical protein
MNQNSIPTNSYSDINSCVNRQITLLCTAGGKSFALMIQSVCLDRQAIKDTS